MGFLTEVLTRQRYPVLLLLVGGILLFVGNYALSGELTKPHVTPQPPNVLLIGLGIAAIIGSAGLFLADEDVIAYRRGCRIHTTGTGFETAFRDSKITVDFGSIQDLYSGADRTSVVVLPANDFFDNRCFDDEHTAAGAFIRKHFSIQDANSIEKLVHEQLKHHPFEAVRDRTGQERRSYGVGTCVYLREPQGHPVRIIFAAIAMDRQPQGLIANLSTVFKAIDEVKSLVAAERLGSIYIPLLGAGKGGVPTEIAFLTLISALLEARCKEGGHHLKESHVVIFQANGKKPQLGRRRAKRVFRQLVTLYQEMST